MYKSDYDYLTAVFFTGKLMWNHWWKR